MTITTREREPSIEEADEELYLSCGAVSDPGILRPVLSFLQLPRKVPVSRERPHFSTVRPFDETDARLRRTATLHRLVDPITLVYQFAFAYKLFSKTVIILTQLLTSKHAFQDYAIPVSGCPFGVIYSTYSCGVRPHRQSRRIDLL